MIECLGAKIGQIYQNPKLHINILDISSGSGELM